MDLLVEASMFPPIRSTTWSINYGLRWLGSVINAASEVSPAHERSVTSSGTALSHVVIDIKRMQLITLQKV